MHPKLPPSRANRGHRGAGQAWTSVTEMSVRRLNEPAPVQAQADAEAHGSGYDRSHIASMQTSQAQDVRLTMGGEPTFVGIDRAREPAMEYRCPRRLKSGLADWLLSKLSARRWRRAALLHYGQGKWYPGEPLPRWALSCFWRADGVPVWEDVRSYRVARIRITGSARPTLFEFHEGADAATAGERRKLLPAFDAGCASRRSLRAMFCRFAAGNRTAVCAGRVSCGSRAPERLVLIARRFAHRLPHSDRIDALGCAG